MLVPATVLFALNRMVDGLDNSFEHQMRENLDNVMLWIQRLQKSNKQVEFPIELQANVLFTVENAMQYDFNLMIEDFQLYGMITPKMQNELIDLCFEDFLSRF